MNSPSQYVTGREIARGGMGAVLDARDQKLGRNVAMKVMLRRNASEEQQQRFLQEARVLGQLAHPNIVPIHDVGTDQDGRLFYTMKLVQGVTLQEVLDRLKAGDPDALARHPLSSLLTIFQKVCDAVGFAHSRGIIHRDLKPQNIMVGEFGEVLVMDWGLAKILSENAAAAATNPFPVPRVQLNQSGPTGTPPSAGALVDQATEPGTSARPPGSDAPADAETIEFYQTLEGAVIGTPHYMSPEQAEGRIGQLDTRSDIYSLGGILYALLTLQPPVDGDSPVEILSKVCSGHIVPPVSFNTPVPATLARDAKRPAAVEANKSHPLPHCPGGRVPAAMSAVTMKALMPDRARRYQRVAELAADIAAYQGGFATRAEEAGVLTLVRLFLRRHKALSAAAGVIVLLAVGLMASVVSRGREAVAHAQRAEQGRIAEARLRAKAEQAEAAATTEARNATALVQLLTGLFDDADPIARHGRALGGHQGAGPNLTARELIDRGAARLQGSLREDPRVRALLLDKIGAVYLSLGLYQPAAPVVQEALELRRKLFGPEHPEVARSLQSLGALQMYRQEFDEAEQTLKRALDIERRAFGNDHPLVADVLLDLGVVRLVQDDMPQAEKEMREALEIRREHFPPQSSEVLTCLIFLAAVESNGGGDSFAQLETLQALSASQGAGEVGEFFEFASQALIATVLQGPEAHAQLLEAEKKGVAALGGDHLFVNLFRLRFGDYLKRQKRWDEARDIYRKGIASVGTTMGTNSIFLTGLQVGLGSVEYEAKRLEASEAAFRECIRIYQLYGRKKGSAVYARREAGALQKLGRTLNQRKAFPEAQEAFARGVILERKYGDGSPAEAPAGLVVSLQSTKQKNLAQAQVGPRAAAGNPERALAIARQWTSAARKFQAQKPNATAEDQIVLDSLRLGALTILNQAVRDGFRDRQRLQSDADFEILRERTDFQQLLGRLDRPPNGPR